MIELSDRLIRDARVSRFPPNPKPTIALSLNLQTLPEFPQGRIHLRPVREESQWRAMHKLRREVEKAFGNFSEQDVQDMIKEIQRCQDQLPESQWFLAYRKEDEEVVGEIGLVSCPRQLGSLGRLQDVDIAPNHQGKGYGRDLLQAIANEARKRRLTRLVLRAEQDSWVHDWYQRFGFVSDELSTPTPEKPRVITYSLE